MTPTRSAWILRIARDLAGRKTADLEEGAEGGFTLIELMVVLLIMAILLAIAIPTFLGVKGSAQNRAAESDLTNAVTSAKSVATNAGTYGTPASLVSGLKAAEPEMTFVQGNVASTTPHDVSVYTSTDGLIMILAEQSANGLCWYAEDNEENPTATTGGLTNATSTQGISYGSSNGTTAASCTANGATPTSGWKGSYPST